ncbi:MAG: hypothetical protein K8R85_08060, partial [Bacteroidetes bacterium]|nr:hypothetical protein [Bacteroidota bacterium]
TKNKEYIDFLKQKEFIFDIKPKEESFFPALKLDWNYPSIITNVLVHVNTLNAALFKLLSALNVKTMGVIVSKQDSINKINNFLNLDTLKKYSLQSFNIILLESDIDNIDLLEANPFITNITNLDQISKKNILEENRIVLNNPSINLYTEAQKHHTYFNRKLYIDEIGNIKNAPTSEDTFGKVKNIKTGLQLKAIVQSRKFQKYWFVNKEVCDICKDCEFRYMCVDNRLPIKRNIHSWYHKIEFNYNPYIAKWKDEKGYKTLAECGVSSSRDGFTINKEKLNQINKKLWGDD